MKLTTTLLTFAMTSAAVVAPSALAQTADLSVTGKIFPNACTIELGNNGVADLGDISTRILNANSSTVLAPVSLPMSINCTSKTRYGLQGVDNMEGTANATFRYGLGLTPDDEKIGGVQISMRDVSVNGGTAYATISSNSGASWTSSLGSASNLGKTVLLGFAETQGVVTGPAAAEILGAELVLTPHIEATRNLTINDDVAISGSVTINLTYL
ncbi:DUF1120 domain-containing protein [Stenotrophomonas bentonitica]|uniref:DUF1120 domain-containing protein n=1 Tax=Stenotrophomonas bentonitica TaxID=1450134 RepID=UPI00345E8B15